MKPLSDRRLEILLFSFALLMCAWPFPFFPELGSPNELSRLYLARAIVDDGSFSLDGQVLRHGRITDLAVFAGRLYSDKAPGTGMAGALVYAAAKLATGWDAEALSNAGLLKLLRLLLSALPTAAAALLLFSLLHRLRLSPAWRWLLCAAWLCATSAYPYGVLLFGHQAAACLLLAALWLIEAEPAEWRRSLGAGAALGAAVLFEYTTVLAAAPLAVLALARLRHRHGLIMAGVLGASLPLGLLGFYHAACFGGIVSLGYGNLLHQSFADVHNRGLWGLIAPSPLRLLDILFGTSRGLFFFAPWLALSGVGFFLGSRRKEQWRRFFWCFSITALLYLLFAASLQLPAWGWSMGPRHLVPLFPFLVLGVGRMLGEGGAWERWGGRLLWALVPYSAAAVVPATVVFGGFPPDFSNPLAEFVRPLLEQGCTAASLGDFLLPGWVSALVPLLLAAAALAPWLAVQRESIRWKAASLALALALSVLAYTVGGPPHPQKEQTLSWIEKHILHCPKSPPQ